MAETGTFVGTPPEQLRYDQWYRDWFFGTFFDMNSQNGPRNYAMLARANTHIPSGPLWRQLFTLQQLPVGVPLHCPFAPAKRGHWYCQVRIGGANEPKRYVHRLAAVAFKRPEDGRQKIQQDPTFEACHRLMSYPGSERDMNSANLYLSTGEVNRSQLFCKLLFYIRTGYRDASEYALAVTSPGARAPGGVLWTQAGSQERFFEQLEASQEVTDEQFVAAEQHVRSRCVEVHTEERHCLFYHRASEAARRHNLGPIPSVVASFSAIPDFAENVQGAAAKRVENIRRANAITGLDLHT